MARGKGHSASNRFTSAALRVAGSPQPPANIGELRNLQRAEVSKFNDNAVYLPNPSAEAPFDRHHPQTYEQKIYGLGLAPNIPHHFWQLLKGDSGAGSSVYRTTELFQLLAPLNDRTAGTPYSQAIEIATMKATDQRPRYFQASLFSVGRIFGTSPGTATPLPHSDIVEFAPGIPAGTPSISGNTQFGVPQFSTTQFRIMVFDESGQRFVDVDVLGTRSMNLYGFGVTVFALIKEDGYEIDRQRDDNRALGPGLIDQSVVGARIIPIRTNERKNITNRTVTITAPVGGVGVAPTVVPIPPGARTVQGYLDLPFVGVVAIFFATVDPLDPSFPVIGNQGILDFPPTSPTRSDITDIPNSNAIVIENPAGEPARIWSFVFEVTS